MKLKKVIAVIVVLAVTVGAVTGGIYGYKSYQKKNLVAEVQSVSSLNYGYYGNSETSYGVVTNDSSQEVYLDDSNKVQEVYVSKGDTVKEGDRRQRSISRGKTLRSVQQKTVLRRHSIL